jgi:hypothetical protein
MSKPHIRLRCKFTPFIPRLGMTILVWRADLRIDDGTFTDYGAWFQSSAKALAAIEDRKMRWIDIHEDALKTCMANMSFLDRRLP